MHTSIFMGHGNGSDTGIDTTILVMKIDVSKQRELKLHKHCPKMGSFLVKLNFYLKKKLTTKLKLIKFIFYSTYSVNKTSNIEFLIVITPLMD